MNRLIKVVTLLIIGLLFASCAKNEPRPIDISKEASYYLFGIQGYKKDAHKALMLYGNACEKGHALSCGMIGSIYESEMVSGGAIPKDLKVAKKWYQKTCDMGEQAGCNAVERITAITSNDPCHLTFNSFTRHVEYIYKHDSSYIGVSKLCKHYEAALKDARKIKKVCSAKIKNLRELDGDFGIILRSQTHRECRYRPYR